MRSSVLTRVFVGLCGVAFLLAGCTTKTAQTAAPAMAAPVKVAKATQRNVPVELTAIGTGEAYSTVSIKSQVNAQLEAVHFTQGDFVSKGQLLFTLDARPFQAAVAQSEAALAKDKAQQDLDDVQSERYKKLFDAGVASKEQFDQMTRDLQQHNQGYQNM